MSLSCPDLRINCSKVEGFTPYHNTDTVTCIYIAAYWLVVISTFSILVGDFAVVPSALVLFDTQEKK